MDGSYHVLHVDDDPAFVDLSAAALEAAGEGITVHGETDTDAALDRLATEPVDCVVTDYEMPGTDGVAFVRRVREHHPTLPCILFTGRGSEAIASDAISAGITDYLRKGTGTDQFVLLARRVVDAVDRERTEAELRRTRRWISTLVEESTDVITVVGTDGTFEYVSPAIERLLGHDPAALDGEDSLAYVHPADRERAGARLASLVAHPEDELSDELRLRHADGSWVWVENRGRNLLEDPDVGGIVVYTRGIEARKRHDRRLRHYEAIVENMDDVAYTVDRSLAVTYANDRALAYAELPREEIVGEPIAALTDSMLPDREHAERFVEALTAVVEGVSDSERLELGIDLPRGTVFAELQVTPLRGVDPPDGGECPRGAVVISRDVTERTERKRELERQNERLDEFASVISHDLRGPLAVASGNLDLVRDEYDDDRLDAAQEALDRTDRLVEGVLASARHGTPVEEYTAVDLDAVAAASGDLVEHVGGTVEIDTGLTIRADELRLQQLFWNLFRNCVEHGSANDAVAGDRRDPSMTADASAGVTVRVGRLGDADENVDGDGDGDGDGDENEDGGDENEDGGDESASEPGRVTGFYVEDDGPGIPEDERETVFEAGHTTTAGGTGFGLMIVRTIAEAHDWDVTVTESAAGGARFEVRNVIVASDGSGEPGRSGDGTERDRPDGETSGL